MDDSEPLNKQISTNGQIQPQDQQHQTRLQINGAKTYNKCGEDSLSDPSNGKELTNAVVIEHFEAPCCRDIHGKEPPDGGTRAWLVMLSAFLCNGVIFGIINTYGVLHSLLTDRLTQQGDKEASSKAALVGSLTIGTTFLLSPVAGCLTDKIGLRLTTFSGGVLSAGGLLLSSFFTENIKALYFTYGIMFGFGAALAYTPTLAILGHYFKRYLGKVSGFVTAGSSVFTVILPPCLDKLLKGYGLQTTLQTMSLISAFIIVCSFVYKPLHPPPEPPKRKPGRSRISLLLRSIVNVDIWKRKKYVIWALCVPLALFGYFVPYVHMMKFIETTFPGRDVNLPVMCIGITSGLGRLIFGVIADLPGVNRIYLQQLSLVCIGIVTVMLPMTSSYIALIIFTLVMGLFDGCFISLLGPIAYEICGPSGATQAIGFLLGLSSLPLTCGPPIAGKIYDSTGSYKIPFILAGIPPIVGASIMFLIRCIRDENNTDISNTTIRSIDTRNSDALDVEKSPNGLSLENQSSSKVPLMNGHISEAIDDTHSPQANGNGRLAHTGISSNSASTVIAYAFDQFRSSAIKTNISHTRANTALLNRSLGSMSTPVADEQFGACCLSDAQCNSFAKKRRYTYSIY